MGFMVYQPPTGARDLLPLDVAQKQWIEERLQQVWRRWGYHRIITSTLERLDTLMAGGAIDQSTVIQLQTIDDEMLGLRPELTASIARAAVTRMAGMTYPQRLYYNANVFRRAARGSHSRQQEFYQAGVELLGAGGLRADAEVLLLLADCLHSLRLDPEEADQGTAFEGKRQSVWHVILGEAGLTRSLLSPFPATLRNAVRKAIAHLDQIALETLPLTRDLRQLALLLLSLRGHPADVLERVSNLDLTSAQQDSLNNLKSLVELVGETFAIGGDSPAPAHLLLDLSLIQTFDYYTGIVFEVISDGAAGHRVVGQGGRYDQLPGIYHPQGQSCPGIGFCLNLEDLHHVLLPTGKLPDRTPTSDWLVVPETEQAYAAAFAHAQQLRSTPKVVRVEVELGSHQTPEAIRQAARDRRITSITWVDATGMTRVEPLLEPVLGNQ